MRPTEAWSDFVQRVFENEWVEVVGSMAGAGEQECWWSRGYLGLR